MVKTLYGRPGIGKSISILNYVHKSIKKKVPIFYFTLDYISNENFKEGKKDVRQLMEVLNDKNLKK